jgi:hypothetical protein
MDVADKMDFGMVLKSYPFFDFHGWGGISHSMAVYRLYGSPTSISALLKSILLNRKFPRDWSSSRYLVSVSSSPTFLVQINTLTSGKRFCNNPNIPMELKPMRTEHLNPSQFRLYTHHRLQFRKRRVLTTRHDQQWIRSKSDREMFFTFLHLVRIWGCWRVNQFIRTPPK